MKKYLFLLLPFCAVGFFQLASCKKDPDTTVIPPVKPPDTPVVYVPIHQPGDTVNFGAGYAKKLTADWTAEAIASVMKFVDTSYIGVGFFTYSKTDLHSQRESLGFRFIKKNSLGEMLKLKKMDVSNLENGYVSPTYTTWRSDGDVIEDQYNLDETATDNYFQLIKADWGQKRVEGTFTASFKIREPRVNPLNPKQVKFSNGRFWANIQD